MGKSAQRIIEGLADAAETARKASEIAFIIQEAREEDVSATRTAYRILGHLGLCTHHERVAEPYVPIADRINCTKCGISLSGSLGYVCPQAGCPTGLGGATS